MAVQTEKETLDMLRTFIDMLEKKAQATGMKLRELRDRELSHQEMQQWLKFLGYITKDGQIMPKSITLNKNEKEKLEYILKQAEQNNVKDLFKTLDNKDGTITVMTNEDGFNFFIKHSVLYEISHPERAGEIREVSLKNDIDAAVDSRSKTVLKGLTENQYLALTKKVYNSNDKFTFASSVHEKNGVKTYDVVVNSNCFMGGEDFGANDLCSFIIANKLCRNEESEKAIKTEYDLMNKILNYNEDEEMYVTQLFKGDEFLKVTKEGVTVINRNGEEIKINKNDMDKSSFQVNVLRHFDKFSMPFELSDEMCNKLKIEKNNKFDICMNHARTGKDDDFMLDDGKGNKTIIPIPINRNEIFKEAKERHKFIVKLVKVTEQDAYKKFSEEYINSSTSYIENKVLNELDLEIDDTHKNNIINKYKENLAKNIKVYNPSITNCFWNEIQRKALTAAIVSEGINLNKELDFTVPEEINDKLRNNKISLSEGYEDIYSRLKEKDGEFEKLHKELNKAKISEQNAYINTIDNKFIGKKCAEICNNGNGSIVNAKKVLLADTITKEVFKLDNTYKAQYNEIAESVYAFTKKGINVNEMVDKITSSKKFCNINKEELLSNINNNSIYKYCTANEKNVSEPVKHYLTNYIEIEDKIKRISAGYSHHGLNKNYLNDAGNRLNAKNKFLEDNFVGSKYYDSLRGMDVNLNRAMSADIIAKEIKKLDKEGLIDYNDIAERTYKALNGGQSIETIAKAIEGKYNIDSNELTSNISKNSYIKECVIEGKEDFKLSHEAINCTREYKRTMRICENIYKEEKDDNAKDVIVAQRRYLDTLNNDFVGSVFMNHLQGEEVNMMKATQANAMANEIMKLDSIGQMNHNLIADKIYHDLLNGKSVEEITKNIGETFNLDVNEINENFSNNSFIQERMLNPVEPEAYSEETKAYMKECQEVCHKLSDIENHFADNIDNKLNNYDKACFKWYEEHRNIFVLNEKDELVTAYADSLFFTEDSGPLSDIPDTINGTFEDFSHMEVEHVAIDEKGECIDEKHEGQNLYDVMGYDQKNYLYDATISDMNTARTVNRDVQNINKKIYKVNPAPEIGER